MLKNDRFFIQGPGNFDYIKLFERHGYELVDNIDDAGIIVFTGGEDVDPQLYGEKAVMQTQFNPWRDKRDIDAFTKSAGKFRVGICRGSQFLNVMCGGKLWQDVDSHCRDHSVIDVRERSSFLVSSTHHQMMRPTPEAEILWAATEAKFKENYEGFYPTDGADVEACWYPKQKCLCVQSHPEFTEDRYKALQKQFMELINEFH